MPDSCGAPISHIHVEIIRIATHVEKDVKRIKIGDVVGGSP